MEVECTLSQDENKKKKIKKIKDELDTLRKPNGNKPKREISPDEKFNTIDDVVPKVWKELGLEGRPKTKLVELLLIGLIEDQFGDWDTEKHAQDRRKKAKMRDVTLLSFGLLDEYYHTDIIWSEDRYETYLNKSDFIKLEYPNQGTYQEIKKKNKIRYKAEDKKPQPPPLNSITHIAGDGKEEISKKLYDKLKNDSYKTYWELVDSNESKSTAAMNLPKPCFTIANKFLPINSNNSIIMNDNLDTGDDNNSNGDDLPGTPQLKENKTKEKCQPEAGRIIYYKIIRFCKKMIKTSFEEKIKPATVIFIIFYIIFLLITPGWEYLSVTFTMNKNSTTDAPPVADDALENAVSFKNETAPDVESFNIREKEFSLYPGYSKRLNIEQIYPSNANEFSITYEFVPPGLLKVENNYITALNDVPIGNTSVDVIVKATGHAEIVHITILNPDEKDEISQGGLLFEQSQ
ncbi:hypothetical protein C804_01980 [Lachnospiraceae bacterium A4]|nr:hypothetical protein C804_01980 [Lachnospiraceae bacterium A4]